MKQFVCLVCAVSFVLYSFAQGTTLFITTHKTTSLIFPYPIMHVDRGSKDILVEPVKEAGNILLVKAASKDFPETNLSVFTTDGSVYTLTVNFGAPTVWVYTFPPQVKTSISTYANSIIDNPGTVPGVRDASWNILAKLSGIYVKDDVFYYRLGLQNQSSIDYDIDFLRFYLRNKKQAKRTAAQERELNPLYVAGNVLRVNAGAHNTIVVAIAKFSLSPETFLAIEIGEKNGGRNLLLKVNNRHIVHATPLPDAL